MPLSSNFSDLRPERIIAREEHYCRNGPPSSGAKESVNSTDLLDAIGTHFQLPNKQESWPKSIEDLTDDEGTPRKPDVTPNNIRTSLYPWSDRKGSPPSRSTLTPTRTPTPTQGGAYLPRSEMKEFRRQQSHKRMSGNEASKYNSYALVSCPAWRVIVLLSTFLCCWWPRSV